MKKLIPIFLALCMIIGMAAGCASNEASQTTTETTATNSSETTEQETSESTESSESSESKELLVARWAGPPADYQKEQVKDYTGATVTIDDVDYNSLKEKEILSFQSAAGAAGNYDVVWVNGPWMTEFVEAGYIMPISDLAEELGIDLSIYDENLMSALTYDGEVYGIPTFLQCIIGAYDTAAFDSMGLSAPTSYDEMVETAAALKEAGSGLAMPASQANGSYTVWSELLYATGDYLVEDGQLAVNSDACVAATERYENLVQYACDGSLGWGHEGVYQAMQSGFAPMGLMMSGNCSNLHDAENSLIADTVGYFPFYGYEDQAAANNTYWVWAIPANCEDPAAALEFISWLCSYDVERASSLDMYTVSAITELTEDEELMASVPFAAIVMEQFKMGKADPANANFDALKTDMSVMLSEIGVNATEGGSDIPALLDELQAKYGDMDWNS